MVDMSALVGTVRRLGMAGPPYEVLGPTGPSASGEAQVRIYLIESGEEVEHSLEQVLADPLDD
ncbi:DUF5397 domain-containing protein [Sphingomonas sp. SUN039]|jgi:Family of unknown function (DUF5397)|uniref:DUF5397 domain-containing protein n=1 Tax=Sphingomonas sp. SUN039 TaxID=2937787 RepID=UPI0021646D52|nr:DUF5397 domain-containing protein [Sphingomonas sp. SUN039]UVO55538.1 DUF5397 domain-containing protein [Sphingomonas sp. SUN039]